MQFKPGDRLVVINPYTPLLKVGDEIVCVHHKFDFVGFTHPRTRRVCEWRAFRFMLADTPQHIINAAIEAHGHAVPEPKPAAPVKKKQAVKKQKKKKPKVENIRKFLANADKRGELSGICAFAMQTDEGNLKHSDFAPCHAQLGDTFPHNNIVKLLYGIRYEVKRYILTKKQKKEYREYVKYILNESPWADCFLTKNFSSAMRNDVLMNVAKNRHQIAAACIALREGSEYRNTRLETFYRLVKKGYSGHTAFIISSCFRMNCENVSRQNIGGGHSVLVKTMDANELFKFMVNGYSLGLGEPPFSVCHGSYKVFKYIANEHSAFKDSICCFIDEHAKTVIVGEGFNAQARYTEESIYGLADAIEKRLKELQ